MRKINSIFTTFAVAFVAMVVAVIVGGFAVKTMAMNYSPVMIGGGGGEPTFMYSKNDDGTVTVSFCDPVTSNNIQWYYAPLEYDLSEWDYSGMFWLESTEGFMKKTEDFKTIEGAHDSSVTFNPTGLVNYCIGAIVGDNDYGYLRIIQNPYDFDLTCTEDTFTFDNGTTNTITMKVTPSSTNGNVTYQWYAYVPDNWEYRIIPGETSATYTAKNVTGSDLDTAYACVATDGYYWAEEYFGVTFDGHKLTVEKPKEYVIVPTAGGNVEFTVKSETQAADLKFDVTKQTLVNDEYQYEDVTSNMTYDPATGKCILKCDGTCAEYFCRVKSKANDRNLAEISFKTITDAYTIENSADKVISGQAYFVYKAKEDGIHTIKVAADPKLSHSMVVYHNGVFRKSLDVVENKALEYSIYMNKGDSLIFELYQGNTNTTVKSKITIATQATPQQVVDSLLTAEEKKKVEQGESFNMLIGVDAVANNKLPSTEKALLDNYTQQNADSKVAGIFDINVKINIGDSSRNVTNTSSNLKLSVNLPSDVPTVPSGCTRKYSVIRIHEGKITVLDAKVIDGVVYFESDQFSTYILTYTDISNEAPTTTVAETTTVEENTTDATTVATDETDETDEENTDGSTTEAMTTTTVEKESDGVDATEATTSVAEVDNNKTARKSPVVFIIIGVVALAAVAVGVFFVIKKRK